MAHRGFSISQQGRGARRRSLRRAVAVDCEVRSELWDGAVRLRARDLSLEGMWLDTDLPLDVGDEVLATFSPPGSCLRLHALCEVSRVGMFRRVGDALPSGMGLRFTDLAWSERARLQRSLIGIPPPLPLEVRMRNAGHLDRAPAESTVVIAPCVAVPGVLDPAFAVAS